MRLLRADMMRGAGTTCRGGDRSMTFRRLALFFAF
jgi:hypothetical protein